MQEISAKWVRIGVTRITVIQNRDYVLNEFLKQAKARAISGREYARRRHFIVKLVGFPAVMLLYWYRFYEHGKGGAIDMWIVHCVCDMPHL